MFKAFSLTLAIAAITASANGRDAGMSNKKSLVTAACMRKTDEVGTVNKHDGTEKKSLRPFSNMNHLTRTLKEKALFLNTSAIEVCTNENRIHGIRLSLQFDTERDEELNAATKTLYGHEFAVKTFHETWIGNMIGACSIVHLDDGVFVETVRVKHDEEVHQVAFKLSDGSWELFGGSEEETAGLDDQIFNFGPNDVLAGVYGNHILAYTDKEGKEQKANHFVSLGFIVNECDTDDLVEIAEGLVSEMPINPEAYGGDWRSEQIEAEDVSGREEREIEHEIHLHGVVHADSVAKKEVSNNVNLDDAEASGDEVDFNAAAESQRLSTRANKDSTLEQDRQQPMALMIAVVVLAITLAITCLYTCLKSRGMILSKEKKAAQSDFDQVEQSSPTKKKVGRASELVAQDSHLADSRVSDLYASNNPVNDSDMKDAYASNSSAVSNAGLAGNDKDGRKAAFHGRSASTSPMTLNVSVIEQEPEDDNENVKVASNDTQA